MTWYELLVVAKASIVCSGDSYQRRRADFSSAPTWYDTGTSARLICKRGYRGPLDCYQHLYSSSVQRSPSVPIPATLHEQRASPRAGDPFPIATTRFQSARASL